MGSFSFRYLRAAEARGDDPPSRPGRRGNRPGGEILRVRHFLFGVLYNFASGEWGRKEALIGLGAVLALVLVIVAIVRAVKS